MCEAAAAQPWLMGGEKFVSLRTKLAGR